MQKNHQHSLIYIDYLLRQELFTFFLEISK